MPDSPFRSNQILFAMAWLFVAAFFLIICTTPALAATATATNSCTEMQTWGFTTGIVYCVQTSIDAAVTTYVTAMQGALRYYEGMMAAVAVMLFGFKAMNSNVQEPLREIAMLVVRISIGVFFYENAINIYHWIAGTLPANDGVMNEMIGWVTGTTASGSGGNFFSQLVAGNCTPDTPPVTFEGYQVWSAFDCMFGKIMGAADPSAHPYAFSTSLLTVIAAAIFSATAGVLVASLGLTLFIGALMFIFRALYLVLMAFVCIGFMTLFAPLVAPLVFFESDYLNQKFKSWAGIIISCVFQPVLVIGFLGMGVSIADQIIEGNFASPNCILPTYPSGALDSGRPAAGWGQDGSGVCSFTQLFNQGQSGDSLSLETTFHNFLDENTTFFNQSTYSDPQSSLKSTGFTAAAPSNFHNGNGGAGGMSNVIPAANSLNENAATISWNGATRLKNFAPVRQLLLTLLTFIFTIYAMKELLEVVPQMAQRLTISVGVGLWQGLRVPFEDGINNLLSQGEKKAASAAQGKGLVPQLFKRISGSPPPASAGSGASGARTVPGGTSAGTIKRS